MDYGVRKKLIQDFLHTWAKLEYGCEFHQAYEKSKASQREFNYLDGMVRDLISTVERLTKEAAREEPLKRKEKQSDNR